MKAPTRRNPHAPIPAAQSESHHTGRPAALAARPAEPDRRPGRVRRTLRPVGRPHRIQRRLPQRRGRGGRRFRPARHRPTHPDRDGRPRPDRGHRPRRHPADRGRGHGLRRPDERGPHRTRVRESRGRCPPSGGPGVPQEVRPPAGQGTRQRPRVHREARRRAPGPHRRGPGGHRPHRCPRTAGHRRGHRPRGPLRRRGRRPRLRGGPADRGGDREDRRIRRCPAPDQHGAGRPPPDTAPDELAAFGFRIAIHPGALLAPYVLHGLDALERLGGTAAEAAPGPQGLFELVGLRDWSAIGERYRDTKDDA